MALRWGIAGVGKISHDFHTALQVKSEEFTGNHEIVAIASRDIERSRKFAEEHQIANYHGSYEELAKNDDIEIIYVATLNPTHYEVCKLMLNYGKHVLCEKPLTMNYRQTKELTDLAKTKKLFLMEGLWSRFFPAYQHLKSLISSDQMKPKEMYLKHGFRGENIDRIAQKEMGGGIVLDIGVYAIQFCLFVFGAEQPLSIEANGKLNKNGVDLEFEVELKFSGDRKARILCSGQQQLENEGKIVTNNGLIKVPSYWCPTSLQEPNGNVKNWPLPSVSSMNFTNSCGLRYEADQVQKCIRAGKLSCKLVSTNDMLIIAQIEDEIRRQIGVKYDCDK